MTEPAKDQKLQPGWRTVRFGEIAENITDRVDDPSQAGVERYVGLEHLDPESLKILRWGAPTDVEATKLRFQSGDIIFGKRRAYQRKLAVVDFEGICSAHAMVLRAKPSGIVAEFLPFFMQSDVFFERALAISVGSLSPTINWSSLAVQEFQVPPEQEQRKIVSLLTAADDCAYQWDDVITNCTSLVVALREKVFGKDVGTRKTVSELFEVQLGKMLSPKAKQGITPKPYLANFNVQWGRFDLDTINSMDFSDEEFEKFRLVPGDLLVCEGGEVGRSAIWNGEIDECCYQKALHRLRPLNGQLHAELMLQFMHWAAAQGLFASLTGHSTIAHLPAIKLKQLLVHVPPPKAQSELVSTFRSYSVAVANAEAQAQKAREVKRCLLSHLLG